jgi:hypothetical protein
MYHFSKRPLQCEEAQSKLPQSTLKLYTYHHYCCFIDIVIDSARIIKEQKTRDKKQHLGILTQRINMK